MPYLDHLKVKPLSVIRSSTWNELVGVVEDIGYEGGVDVYGYAHKDIIPERDLALNLGLNIKRFLKVNCGYGDFSYSVKVQGKEVLKDGDPITVSEDKTTEPQLLGKVWGQAVGDYVDVFGSDLMVQRSGRVRVKLSASTDVAVYLKHKPYDEAAAVIAALNAGATIKANTWFEQELAVMQNDYINIRISPGATLNLMVLNVGSL